MKKTTQLLFNSIMLIGLMLTSGCRKEGGNNGEYASWGCRSGECVGYRSSVGDYSSLAECEYDCGISCDFTYWSSFGLVTEVGTTAYCSQNDYYAYVKNTSNQEMDIKICAQNQYGEYDCNVTYRVAPGDNAYFVRCYGTGGLIYYLRPGDIYDNECAFPNP